MKNIRKTIGILSMIIMVMSCGKDDSPQADPVQTVIDGLGKTWTATSVTFSSQDVTSDWKDFALTFDQAKGYTATALSDENVLVWPASGSYTFPDPANPKIILRHDGVQIAVDNLKKTTATLIFTISGRSGGRTEGLVGEWVFVLAAN
jgi:hypothetical protein